MPSSHRWPRVAGLVAIAAITLFVAAPSADAAVTAPSRPRLVVLTNADSGTTVAVSRGATILVALRATGDRFRWSAPTSENPAVAAPVATYADPSGDAYGLFTVSGTGTADLQAISSCKPDPGRVCPFVAILWRATIQSS
jgi:hypothetical protein